MTNCCSSTQSKEVQQWTCPMHKEVIQNTPGFCPICHMALVPKKIKSKSMGSRWWSAAIGAIIVFTLAMGGMIWPFFHLPFFGWIEALIAAWVVFERGAPFFLAAFQALLQRTSNMFTLIVLGVTTAYLSSLFNLFRGEYSSLYFETAAVIVALVLLGQYLEEGAVGKTSQAMRALLDKVPKRAWKVVNGQPQEVAAEELAVDDLVMVPKGADVPADGVIVQGVAWLDEAMWTGEALPCEKKAGDAVKAGSINVADSFTFKVMEAGRHTQLQHLIDLVKAAQESKAPIQRLADQISVWFVPSVLLIALISGLIAGVQNAVSVLIIACPCALGLATPLCMIVGMGIAALGGILFRDAAALQNLASVHTMAFDKTGTLTIGRPQIKGTPSREALFYAASLEQYSQHPLAKAFLERAKEENILLHSGSDLQEAMGEGIEGVVDDKRIILGTTTFVQRKTSLKPTIEGIHLVVDGSYWTSFEVDDQLRPHIKEVVSQLQKAHIDSFLLSGDQSTRVEAVAKEVGIVAWRAQLLPLQKSEVIETLKTNGLVAMAGDGINDAAALAAADVGIAVASSSQIAIATAPVTLLHSDMRLLMAAVNISRATMRHVKQNLFFAFIYNVLGIVVATGLLEPFGIELNPMIAAFAMSASSLSVVLNALRLKRMTLRVSRL